MADKEEVLPQGMVMDEHGALRPITREEAEHGLHDPKDEPKPEAQPAVAPPKPPVPQKPAEKSGDMPGHAGPPTRP